MFIIRNIAILAKSLFGCAGLKKSEILHFQQTIHQRRIRKTSPKIIEQMNEMPYIDKNGKYPIYTENFIQRNFHLLGITKLRQWNIFHLLKKKL